MGFKRFDISGEKIRLRPIRPSDAVSSYNLVRHDNILKWLTWDGPKSVSELRTYYKERAQEFKTGNNYSLAIEPIPVLEFVGNIAIRFPKSLEQADIGYWLAEPYWNKSYMTEAVKLACHVCFAHLKAERILVTVFVGNGASRAVLEHNGFSLDGTLRKECFKRGEWKDAWFLSLIREEWEPRKEKYLPVFEDVIVNPAVSSR